MTRRFRVTIGGVTYNVDVEELTPAAGTGFSPAAPGPAGIAAAAGPSSAASAAVPAAPPVMAAPPAAVAPAPAPAPASAAASAPAPAAQPAASGGAAPAEGKAVCAPLPGMIVSVPVQVGQQVREGDVVAVLEAMKMENDITSPYAGTVKQVLVSKGTSVSMNDPLVVIG